MLSPPQPRRLFIGAELRGGAIECRVWAPDHKKVSIVIEGGGEHALEPEEGGYFGGSVPGEVGTLYRYRVDGEGPFPDPASRFQPEGPHGPSQVVNPEAYAWRDTQWAGVALADAVICELHVGTFTPDGTWLAAIEKLGELRDLGITVIEMMPIADFPGRFGWGYDGVNLFAPTQLYGEPDDLRRFVDAAHGLGIAVILDVVYNHFGPDGNYLKAFAEDYFTDRYEGEWGQPVNFDGPNAAGSRAFFVANAHYWIDEFHFDGLRLDATQAIHDSSDVHILVEIERAVREAAGARATILITENEPQRAEMIRTIGLDAIWNDDFHHSAMVALTGRSPAYYSPHRGSPQEFVSAAKWGFLYQGQRYEWQDGRRGTPALDLPSAAFVNFLQNHDQVANSGSGLRIDKMTSPGRLRTMTALMLLMPGTPMLFQGQEWCASSPFLYFADHKAELAALVRKGRGEFLQQFPTATTEAVAAMLAAPDDPRTFAESRLDHDERSCGHHALMLALHRDLLALRRDRPEFRRTGPGGVDGAVLDERAFLIRWFDAESADLLLLVNLGGDLEFRPAPEPLLAPPATRRWKLVWSSEHPSYGGSGALMPEDETGRWLVPGESATLLEASEAVQTG